jgi:signal transduction histidine kinase
MLLIAITLALALVFGWWSWRWRQRLTARRREAELALRTSEDQLRQVSSQLPVALFEYVAAPVAGFRSMSLGIARLLPGTAAQMLADPEIFFQGIHADDLPGLIWRAAKPPAGEFEWVGRSRQDDESVRWLQIRATTEITADGEPAIHGVILDVTALKQAQQDLERSRGELRRLATHREAAIELERARLAREVHDELGQVLTAARMQLQLLRSDLAPEQDKAQDKASSRIEDIEMLIGEAYRSVKSIAADLRPAALNLGLTAAVEWLVGRLLTPAGVACEIRFATSADTLAEAQAICLFRIVQESLANIVRHAGAGRVSLSFSCEGSISRLVIRDDGCGFDPDAVDRSKHFGLLGITERVEALGGTLHLASQAGAGTTLTVEVPQ